MFRTISLSLPAHLPLIHRGPSKYLFSEEKHVIAWIYHYIKHIFPKLYDSTQQQHVTNVDGSIVLA